MDVAQASLIVAKFDLAVVQLIRGAMRVADLQAGGIPGPLGTIINPKVTCVGGRGSDSNPEPRLRPSDTILPRRLIHPTPYYEPRPALHPTPRIEPAPPAAPTPVDPGACHLNRNPIQPPWKVLPWQTPIQPKAQIKVVVHRTDVVNKGSLIDMFI